MDQFFGDIGTLVASEGELRTAWSDPGRRIAFIQRLVELGYDADRIEDMRWLINAPNSDIFDVLAYVRFTLAPLTGSQRADAARATGLSGYEPEMREFLGYVLRAYEAHGIAELAPIKIADFLCIRYGGTNDAKQHRGTVPAIRDAFVGTQVRLFPQPPPSLEDLSTAYSSESAAPPKKAVYAGPDSARRLSRRPPCGRSWCRSRSRRGAPG